jgi:hypothetical protein
VRLVHTMLLASLGWLSAGSLAATAYAQELPKEGRFSVTYVLANPNPNKPITSGQPNHEISIGSITAVTVNDEGKPFLNNMAGRCSAVTDHDTSAKTYQRHGLCHFLEQQSGDQVFAEFGATQGKGKWLGGTGKYSGLTGEFDIQFNPVFASEHLILASGKLVGQYKIGK